MIDSPINEFTVFADKLEDEGIDISLLRILCSYNCLLSMHFSSNITTHAEWENALDWYLDTDGFLYGYSYLSKKAHGSGGLHLLSGNAHGLHEDDYNWGDGMYIFD